MTIEAVQAHCWRIGWQLSTCCPSSPPCPALPAGFCSEQVPEGFVAVAKNTLRVITLERVGEFFNQQSLRLRYTPRKFVIHPGALPVGKFGVAGMRACSSRLCMCLISAVNCWVCSFLQMLAEVLTSGISPVTCCPLHPCGSPLQTTRC